MSRRAAAGGNGGQWGRQRQCSGGGPVGAVATACPVASPLSLSLPASAHPSCLILPPTLHAAAQAVEAVREQIFRRLYKELPYSTRLRLTSCLPQPDGSGACGHGRGEAWCGAGRPCHAPSDPCTCSPACPD